MSKSNSTNNSKLSQTTIGFEFDRTWAQAKEYSRKHTPTLRDNTI